MTEVIPLLAYLISLIHEPFHPLPSLRRQNTARVQNPRRQSCCWLPRPQHQLLLPQHPCHLLSGMRHSMMMKRCVNCEESSLETFKRKSCPKLFVPSIRNWDFSLVIQNILLQVVNLSDSDDETLPQNPFMRWMSRIHDANVYHKNKSPPCCVKDDGDDNSISGLLQPLTTYLAVHLPRILLQLLLSWFSTR